MQDLLQVGAVTKPHGIAGEVRVFPTTDDPARFKKLKKVLARTPKGDEELEVEHVKFARQMVILKFRGLERIEDVEYLRGCGLFVTREQAVKLEKDEYFIADLIGMRVISEDGRALGELTDVLQTGANDVYEVTMEDGRTFLIPAIHDCILRVDTLSGLMTVHLLEGLL